jgi:hypothetical protein
MTTPPRRPMVDHNLDLGVTGSQVQVANPKRAAANQRQREEAERAADYVRWRAALTEQIWGRP